MSTIICDKCKEECSNNYYKCLSKYAHDGIIDNKQYILCPNCRELINRVGLFRFDDLMNKNEGEDRNGNEIHKGR